MTLLHNLGSRFRRDENSPESDRLSSSTDCPNSDHVRKPRFPSISGRSETPDLYFADRDLGEAVRNLEDVRSVLHSLTNAAEAHKDMLTATAASQRELGEALQEALDVGGRQSQGGEGEFTDLDVEETEEVLGVVSSFLSDESCESQRCLGRSFVSHGVSMVKLGTAFCVPIADLSASFEDRIVRKIVPLRNRYADQKGQYLKYVRASDAAQDDEKRNYFDALAQAAKPIWVRTSKELRTEANVMTQLTSRNVAKWSRVMALQHERGLSIAATNYADAFSMAKDLSK